jgi:hypothetical protein
MHVINDGYRGIQLLVSINADRLFFVAAVATGLVVGTLGASFITSLN